MYLSFFWERQTVGESGRILFGSGKDWSVDEVEELSRLPRSSRVNCYEECQRTNGHVRRDEQVNLR